MSTRGMKDEGNDLRSMRFNHEPDIQTWRHEFYLDNVDAGSAD